MLVSVMIGWCVGWLVGVVSLNFTLFPQTIRLSVSPTYTVSWFIFNLYVYVLNTKRVYN